MANFRKWGALLLCAVLLAGCAAQPTATPTPTEANTDCNAAANDRSNRRDRHTRHGRGSRLCS